MRIALRSPFFDYYDHAFLTIAHSHLDWVWERKAKDGISRRDAFKLFEKFGLHVPKHGLVKDLVPELIELSGGEELGKILNIVVYVDEEAHAGNGKMKLGVIEALERYPECYASQYLPVFPHWLGTSLRWLRIGMKQIWLRYDSRDDWRSNCGDVEIEITEFVERSLSDSILSRLSPMVAIDFLPIGNKFYAIDLNTAPGLRWTGIEDLMSPEDIYKEVARYVQYAKSNWKDGEWGDPKSVLEEFIKKNDGR